MKKKIQALCASLFMGILLFMAGVQTFAEPSYTSKFSDWGNLLKQYANDENGNEMIYARGKNGVITNKEVEQAMMFYTTFGMNQEDARKQAVLYVEEREALYQQAIEAGYTVTDQEVYDYIARMSSGDVRYAYNCLELATIYAPDTHITLEIIQEAVPRANMQFDKDEDQYYDTLSGLQKSIRGSDPNGALYYFAKLIDAGDIESLERRLITTAYEDIGLANPNACMRTVLAFQAAKTIGFPEARIPLASCIIELALSPKSKSSENAIDTALASYHNEPHKAPQYIRLTPVGIDEEDRYDYNRPDLWEYLQYLPDEIKDAQFYVPWLTSRYEKSLTENYQRILKHGRTTNIRKLKKDKPR